MGATEGIQHQSHIYICAHISVPQYTYTKHTNKRGIVNNLEKNKLLYNIIPNFDHVGFQIFEILYFSTKSKIKTRIIMKCQG